MPKRRVSLNLFVFLLFLQSIGTNYAHPVTPTLITNLQLPSWMFGAAFAAMATMNFMFAPFWGRMSDRIGRIRVLVITTLGYTVGQVLFGMSTNVPTMLLARALAGTFSGGHMVAIMAYIVDITDRETIAPAMAKYAAFSSIGQAVGYLIGGVVGDYSLPLVFALQAGTLLTVAGCIFLFIGEGKQPEGKAIGSVNPFKSLYEAGRFLTPSLFLFMMLALFATMAAVGYDNAFNYFIKDQLGFPSSYNGAIKAVVGIITLIANFTITKWILTYFDRRKSLIGLLALISVTILVILGVEATLPFILINIVYYAFNAVFNPILQSLASLDRGKGSTSGQISGTFNAFKSIGMVVGSLLSGFIYDIHNRLPFIFALGSFIIALTLSVISQRQYQGREIISDES